MKFLRPCAAAIFLGIASTPASGLGIEFGYHDPEVVARGNAGVASATSAAAVYYNPALLGEGPGSDLLLSGYFLEYDFEYQGVLGSAELEGPAYAASAFASVPLGGRTALGFGLYSPFGQQNEFKDASPLRNLALDTNLLYLAGTLALGTEIAPGLRIGVSASISASEADLNRGLIVAGDRFRFEGDGLGWGLGTGFTWDPIEKHRIAGSFRWWSPIDYEGSILTRTVFPTQSAAVLPAEARVDFPREWTLGYAYRPDRCWLFEIDLMFTEWSSFDQYVINTPAGPISEPLDWNDSFKLAAGVTRSWDSGWWLGGGYWFAESTTPDRTFNPRLPDVDIHVVSLGAGYRTDRWAAELTYQLGYGNSRTITGGTPAFPSGISADGKYTYLAHGISAGVRCFW